MVPVEAVILAAQNKDVFGVRNVAVVAVRPFVCPHVDDGRLIAVHIKDAEAPVEIEWSRLRCVSITVKGIWGDIVLVSRIYAA